MRTLGIYVAVAIVTSGAVAPVVAVPSPDAKAMDVLATARKAIGGNKLDALQTFSAQARVQRNVGQFQLSSDVELLLEMPDKYLRSENITGGPMPTAVTTSSGFNGDTPIASGGTAGMGGGVMMFRIGPGGTSGPANAQELTPEQKEQAKKASLRSARIEISRLMLGWFATAHPSIGAEYTYAGEAESPDGKADMVDVKGADGFAARLFIDKQTHLPLMLSFQAPKPRIVTATTGPGGDGRADAVSRAQQMTNEPPVLVENRLYFADWTDMDGLKFPQHIQRAVDGTTQEEWTLNKVKVNPKVDPKKFAPQGEGRPW